MKLLFTIGNLESGGAERVVATLANEFVHNNLDVYIIFLSSGSNNSFYKLDERVKIIPLLKDTKNLSIREKTIRLAKEIDQINPDIVVSFLNYVIFYTFFALKKAKNKNIKFIVSERNYPRKVPGILPLRLLRNHIFRRADGCVFQTNGSKNYFRNVRKSIVIPNPIFLNTALMPVVNRENIILMVGSDKREKNRPMAFKAFSLFKLTHSNYKLVIIGSPSNKSELKLLERLNIKDDVVFLGVMNNWHEKYYTSKMFVLTSNFEGMPNALMEACALQIPCISTDCPPGGPKEIIQNNSNGILVKTNDYRSLAKSMSILADDDKLCNLFSKNNVSLKDSYNPNKISQKWIEFLQKII